VIEGAAQLIEKGVVLGADVAVPFPAEVIKAGLRVLVGTAVGSSHPEALDG
jgi:hypothetical protein